MQLVMSYKSGAGENPRNAVGKQPCEGAKWVGQAVKVQGVNAGGCSAYAGGMCVRGLWAAAKHYGCQTQRAVSSFSSERT